MTMTTAQVSSDDRTNWFDDGILESWRVKEACRGFMRQLHKRDFNAGGGDFETLCRAVSLLCGFYQNSASIMLRYSILKAADMCIALLPSDGRRVAESLNETIVDMFGVVYPAQVVGWCAVCHVKGSTAYDLEALWKDSPIMCRIISAAMKNFDKLSKTRYNENDVKVMLHS